MEQQQVRRQRREHTEEPVETPAVESESSASTTEALLDEIDKILDESAEQRRKFDAILDDIDEALGENVEVAEAFVKSFVQQTGE